MLRTFGLMVALGACVKPVELPNTAPTPVTPPLEVASEQAPFLDSDTQIRIRAALDKIQNVCEGAVLLPTNMQNPSDLIDLGLYNHHREHHDESIEAQKIAEGDPCPVPAIIAEIAQQRRSELYWGTLVLKQQGERYHITAGDEDWYLTGMSVSVRMGSPVFEAIQAQGLESMHFEGLEDFPITQGTFILDNLSPSEISCAREVASTFCEGYTTEDGLGLTLHCG